MVSGLVLSLMLEEWWVGIGACYNHLIQINEK